MVFFVRITVNQSHLRPICKSTKFNPKIQRTIYLINFQQLRLHVPDFIRTVVNNIMKMKRTFITAFFAMLLVVFSVSCSSEDNEFDYAALPMSAQLFVKQYFADATYSRVEKEKDDGFWEYEVWLSDGSKVEFNEKGEWTSVECKYSEMPVGIIPTVIAEDIAKRYPDLKPYKIEKEVGGYEIDIPGYDLYYSYNGMFIRVEIDK